MNKKDFGFSYINQKGRKVSGTAAALHHIYTKEGGLRNHDKNVIHNFLKKSVYAFFLDTFIPTKKTRRNRFKKVK